MENTSVLSLGVLLVVGEVGLNEQLFADKLRGHVASFADFTRGTKVLHRRGYGSGISIDADFNELLGSIDLGLEMGLQTGADMALHTIYVGMRGDLIGGVLGMHYVAGLAAELRRVHISNSAIAGNRHHEQ